MTNPLRDAVEDSILSVITTFGDEVPAEHRATLISDQVRHYLRLLMEARSQRFRDMSSEDQYLLAKLVACPYCDAAKDELCVDRRRTEPHTNSRPHIDRLSAGYSASHVYRYIDWTSENYRSF